MDPKEVYLSKPWLKYYPEGVPHTVEAADKTVQELFDGIADKYGKKPTHVIRPYWIRTERRPFFIVRQTLR